MNQHIGQYAGIPITLDMDLEVNRAIHGLITSQQDTIEALRGVDDDIAETMKRLIDREDG